MSFHGLLLRQIACLRALAECGDLQRHALLRPPLNRCRTHLELCGGHSRWRARSWRAAVVVDDIICVVFECSAEVGPPPDGPADPAARCLLLVHGRRLLTRDRARNRRRLLQRHPRRLAGGELRRLLRRLARRLLGRLSGRHGRRRLRGLIRRALGRRRRRRLGLPSGKLGSGSLV